MDRVDQVRSDPERLAALRDHPNALQLAWRDGLPAVGIAGQLEWTGVTAPDLLLGLDGESPRYSAIEEPTPNPRSAFPYLAILSESEAPIFAAALSLASWHVRHRFCANCGQPTKAIRAGWSRRCPSCSAEHFPRVDPVVIMLAEHDGQVLLGRQPHYPPGRYSALAGFVEVGESLEDAVARELKEEAGIDVSDVRYVASQPWPFPSSLMIGCSASAADNALTIDKTELDDARWFSRAEVEAALRGDTDAPFQAPPKAAIARTLLEHWLAA